ncbi:transcriptional antitermination N peptide [Morganella morganii]|uniref:transcriptional antitermination N peptide n=1 Tax=Morganella morganii TaxID=582 RepID=UPI00406BD564
MLFKNDDSELCIGCQNGDADKASAFSEGFGIEATHGCTNRQSRLFGGNMAIIIVKKSRKPEFLRGNSANRRHARRKAEAIATKNVKMKLEEIFRTEPDKSPMNRVEKATSACSTPIYDSPDNCCLNTTALYSTKRYKSKPKTEFGITARA